MVVCFEKTPSHILLEHGIMCPTLYTVRVHMTDPINSQNTEEKGDYSSLLVGFQ